MQIRLSRTHTHTYSSCSWTVSERSKYFWVPATNHFWHLSDMQRYLTPSENCRAAVERVAWHLSMVGPPLNVSLGTFQWSNFNGLHLSMVYCRLAPFNGLRVAWHLSMVYWALTNPCTLKPSFHFPSIWAARRQSFTNPCNWNKSLGNCNWTFRCCSGGKWWRAFRGKVRKSGASLSAEPRLWTCQHESEALVACWSWSFRRVLYPVMADTLSADLFIGLSRNGLLQGVSQHSVRKNSICLLTHCIRTSFSDGIINMCLAVHLDGLGSQGNSLCRPVGQTGSANSGAICHGEAKLSEAPCSMSLIPRDLFSFHCQFVKTITRIRNNE